MVHSVSGWTRGVQVKLWDPLRVHTIPEYLRGVITTRNYTNPRLPYLTLSQNRVYGSKIQWCRFGLKTAKSPEMWIMQECTCSESSILATSMVYLEPKCELKVAITSNNVRLAVDMSDIVVLITFLSDVWQFHPVPLAVGHSVITLACPCLHDESLWVDGGVGYGKHHLNNSSITAVAVVVVAVVALLMVLLALVIDWARLNVPPNTLQVISGTIFTGHMTKPTESKHRRKPVGLSDKAWIPPGRLHHFTIIQLGNRLYAWRKGPNVTNPICWTCKNCSYKCAADCEHCVTEPSTEQFW